MKREKRLHSEPENGQGLFPAIRIAKLKDQGGNRCLIEDSSCSVNGTRGGITNLALATVLGTAVAVAGLAAERRAAMAGTGMIQPDPRTGAAVRIVGPFDRANMRDALNSSALAEDFRNGVS